MGAVCRWRGRAEATGHGIRSATVHVRSTHRLAWVGGCSLSDRSAGGLGHPGPAMSRPWRRGGADVEERLGGGAFARVSGGTVTTVITGLQQQPLQSGNSPLLTLTKEAMLVGPVRCPLKTLSVARGTCFASAVRSVGRPCSGAIPWVLWVRQSSTQRWRGLRGSARPVSYLAPT